MQRNYRQNNHGQNNTIYSKNNPKNNPWKLNNVNLHRQIQEQKKPKRNPNNGLILQTTTSKKNSNNALILKAIVRIHSVWKFDFRNPKHCVIYFLILSYTLPLVTTTETQAMTDTPEMQKLKKQIAEKMIIDKN